MKRFFQILVFILLVIAGFYYLHFTIETSDEDFIFYGLFSLILIILFLLFLGLTFSFNYRNYKKSGSYMNFVFTGIGFLFIISFFIVHFFLWFRDSSKVILYANYDEDINGCSFEFREDGTYKFHNYSVLGGSFHRGKYVIKDSLIFLDKNEIGNVIKTNQIAIRRNEEGDLKLIQIDKSHNRIEDSYFDFVVRTDKR